MLFVATNDLNTDINDPAFQGQLVDYSEIDTPFCELSILEHLLETKPNLEHLGLISSSFQAKTNILPSEFESKAKKAIADGYDVVVLNPYRLISALYPNSYYQGEVSGHNGLGELALRAGFISEPLEHLPLDTLIFCNFFYATKEFYENYFLEVERVIELMRSEDRLWSLANSAGGYRWRMNLPLIVFFLERMLGSYLASNKNTIQICDLDCFEWRKRKYGGFAHVLEGLLKLRTSFDSSGSDLDRERLDLIRHRYVSDRLMYPLDLIEEPNRSPEDTWITRFDEFFA